MNKTFQIALFIMLVFLALSGNVFAQDAEYVETDDGFADSITNCRMVGNIYREDMDQFSNGDFSIKGVRWQEFVYNLRYDSTLYCGFATSTVASEKYAEYENEIADAAYKFMTAYELRLIAIENENNAGIQALADKIAAEAETAYQKYFVAVSDVVEFK